MGDTEVVDMQHFFLCFQYKTI